MIYEYEVLRDMKVTGIPIGIISTMASKGWRVVQVLSLTDPKQPGDIEVLFEREVTTPAGATVTLPPTAAAKKKA